MPEQSETTPLHSHPTGMWDGCVWNMLHLFVRKGWFFQLEHPQVVPVMTSDEFLARGEVLRRKEWRFALVGILLCMVGAFGCSRLSTGIEQSQNWIQVLAVFGILIFLQAVFSCAVWRGSTLLESLVCTARLVGGK